MPISDSSVSMAERIRKYRRLQQLKEQPAADADEARRNDQLGSESGAGAKVWKAFVAGGGPSGSQAQKRAEAELQARRERAAQAAEQRAAAAKKSTSKSEAAPASKATKRKQSTSSRMPDAVMLAAATNGRTNQISW